MTATASSTMAAAPCSLLLIYNTAMIAATNILISLSTTNIFAFMIRSFLSKIVNG